MNNTTKRQKPNYWNEQTCYQEAQKYNSRSEFIKGCESAYKVALKNGWLDNYTWLTRPKQHNIKWTYETCYQEAQKYNSRNEFQKGCGRAYQVARKNDWLDNYTWFTEKQKPSGYWTEQTCCQEALKYKSRIEFAKGCNSAYTVALKNGWLDNYTWFISKQKPSGYWNKKTCYQEAKNYKSRREFQKGCGSAYTVARENGWLDNYTWFEKDLNPYKNKRDNVYCYIFESLKSVYVGRTIDINKRNKEHNTNENSSVYKFAKQNNIVISQITILETNLSLEEGLEKEHFYVTKFKQEGWNVLNKAKTGKNSGALGSLGYGKWNEQTCYQEAQNYNSRSEFSKGNGSAYDVALKNGWLDNYTWFSVSKTSKKWNEQTCYQVAQKYKSRSEFSKGNGSAYDVARKNGWLDNYTWFTEKQKPSGYWNKKTCYQEALKYKSRIEFQKGCSGAYDVARKNGWLDNYTWFISRNELQKINQTKWTKQTCYQEAQNYNSRIEFQKGCSGAYDVALKNGWLDNYTWFKEKKKCNYWNEQTCYQEALKYKSRIEFQKGCGSAYTVARKNGWLDNYTWFISKQKPSGYWNKKTCYQEAQKYNSRSEFEKGCGSAYTVARKNGWLDNYTWFIEKKQPNGYWNEQTCYQEALKYKSRSEFKKGCNSAYTVARKNGWLDNYTWFTEKQKPSGYWTYETCYQEALKYKSGIEFVKGCNSAYDVARKNGWINVFFPKRKSGKI